MSSEQHVREGHNSLEHLVIFSTGSILKKIYMWNWSTQEYVSVRTLPRLLWPHVCTRQKEKKKKKSHMHGRNFTKLSEFPWKAEKWENSPSQMSGPATPPTLRWAWEETHEDPAVVFQGVKLQKKKKKNVGRVETTSTPTALWWKSSTPPHKNMPGSPSPCLSLPPDHSTKHCLSSLSSQIKEAAHGEQRLLYHLNGTCEQHTTGQSQGWAVHQWTWLPFLFFFFYNIVC